MLTPKFDDLVEQLQVLPGVGRKSAQRMALQLLGKKRQQGLRLAHSLQTAMLEIVECARCHSYSDDAICPICADRSRQDDALCVVEQASDVIAIEQSGVYRGRYFVLGGHLSPLDGVGVEELRIDELLLRLQDDSIDELILATGATVEGQTTAHFIAAACADRVAKITRLAQGIPMGGELEYLDGLTLGQAMQNRVFFD